MIINAQKISFYPKPDLRTLRQKISEFAYVQSIIYIYRLFLFMNNPLFTAFQRHVTLRYNHGSFIKWEI